jgi:hypothetical protein
MHRKPKTSFIGFGVQEAKKMAAAARNRIFFIL